MRRAGVHPTRLVLLGHDATHSLSPIFQNAALVHLNLPQRYSVLDVAPAELARVLLGLAAEGVAGNVTMPHKAAVAALAQCSALALRVGAVNTFWFERGALMGDNTDVPGIIAALATLCPGGVGSLRAVVLGAGGAAAAAVVALHLQGCTDIGIAARAPGQAEQLAARVGVPARVTPIADAASGAELIINATSIGLHTDEHPVAPSRLAANTCVLDLVYRRERTAWVRACRERGHRAEDGLHMLVEQGAASFERWFGVSAPRAVMWSALSRARVQ